EEIITNRPADNLAPELEKAKVESQGFAKSETDVISYAIFGEIAKKFLTERNEGRLSPEALTTFDGDNSPLSRDFTINLHGETYNIKIEGSGEKNASVRPFFVRVDGELKEVLLEENNANTPKTQKSDSLPQASLPGHIISPMPGNLTKLNVKVGDKIKEGDVLAIVEAMKMENQVLATIGGEIKEIYAHVGQQISANLAIMLVE
ncbi:MAG: biotin/lipoyl-containing protein, partial [Helicobacter sp.]|nr:biotin/lipoyl-containing protein [Helicobacter sp.]